MDNSSTSFNVRLIDVLVLLFHLYRGSQLEEVGFEDADHTLDELSKLLYARKDVPINREVLESALWSCNLMDENGLFWHPKGYSFKKYIDMVLSPHAASFDLFYNWIINERRADKKETSK